MTRKILITGASGQVGWELARTLQGLGEVSASPRRMLDLSDLAQVRQVVRALAPDLIVNAAAYTAVDQAERDAALAMRINADAPAVLAEEAVRLGAALVHYSTDYVFDGMQATPYDEDAPARPVNAYGRSKLAGEQAIQASGAAHVILRTSWVYGMRGRNFLLTVLRLARTQPELRIVDDQHGAPTWCRTVAELTAHIVAQGASGRAGAGDALDWWHARSGVYHLSAQGGTTWHGFTQAIVDRVDLPAKPRVVPIETREYPLPAARPACSLLDGGKLARTFGVRAPDWRDALDLCLGTETQGTETVAQPANMS